MTNIKRESLELLEKRINSLYDDIIKSTYINLHEVITDIDFVSDEELTNISNYLYSNKKELEKSYNCKIKVNEQINNDVISITVQYS